MSWHIQKKMSHSQEKDPNKLEWKGQQIVFLYEKMKNLHQSFRSIQLCGCRFFEAVSDSMHRVFESRVPASVLSSCFIHPQALSTSTLSALDPNTIMFHTPKGVPVCLGFVTEFDQPFCFLAHLSTRQIVFLPCHTLLFQENSNLPSSSSSCLFKGTFVEGYLSTSVFTPLDVHALFGRSTKDLCYEDRQNILQEFFSHQILQTNPSLCFFTFQLPSRLFRATSVKDPLWFVCPLKICCFEWGPSPFVCENPFDVTPKRRPKTSPERGNEVTFEDIQKNLSVFKKISDSSFF